VLSPVLGDWVGGKGIASGLDCECQALAMSWLCSGAWPWLAMSWLCSGAWPWGPSYTCFV